MEDLHQGRVLGGAYREGGGIKLGDIQKRVGSVLKQRGDHSKVFILALLACISGIGGRVKGREPLFTMQFKLGRRVLRSPVWFSLGEQFASFLWLVVGVSS